MKINSFLTFLVLILSLFISSEEGIAFKEKYEISVELEGTDKSSIRNGMSLALRQIVVDLSGNSEVVNDPSIRRALTKPEDLVSQYQLISEENSLLGTFFFDGEAIRGIISTNKLPIWTGKRQKALLFLPCRNNIFDSKGSLEEQEAFNSLCLKSSELLKDIALERNLILIEPSLDLEDLNSIYVYKNLFDHSFLRNIASRYGLKYWSVCNIQDDFGILLEEAKCSTSVSEEKYLSINSMINTLANETNKEAQILVNSEERANLILKISGIESLEAYLEVKKIIQSNVLVESYELSSIKNDSLEYNLNIAGSILDLRKLMDSSPILIKSDNKEVDSSSLISYSLVKK